MIDCKALAIKKTPMKKTVSCWSLGNGEYLISSPDGGKELLQVKVVKRLVEAPQPSAKK